MSDLINRSALIEDIDKQVEELQRDGRKDEARGITLEFVEAFKKIINNQPTAYDVDAVVEQIHGYFKSVIDKSDSDNVPLEVLDYNKAICDIVRGGRE